MTITPEYLLKFDRSSTKSSEFRAFLKHLDPELLKYRRRIMRTQSDFLPALFNEVRKGYSPIIIICGRPRSGKSNFGLFIATASSVLLFYRWFDINDCFFYPKDLLRSLDDAGFQIKIMDEAGSALNKRKYYEELTIVFDQIIQTQGYLLNIYIFILPFATDLVKDLRKYTDYVCYIKKRGVARIRKVYKKEDQMVSDLKAFSIITIEDLVYNKEDVPKALWAEFERRSFIIKKNIKDQAIKSLKSDGPKDWLEDD